MVRSILAATLALALALPATTTPVRADAEDVARVVGGLAALYILKEAIERRQDRRDRRQVHAPSTRHHTPHHTHRNGVTHRHSDAFAGHRHRGQDQPNRRRDVKIIPEQCLRNFNTTRGQITAYGARCMQNRVARPGILPPSCIRQVNTLRRGLRNVYGPRCLARNGWSTRHARR